MDEVAEEGHKATTMHVAQEEKNNLGAAESVYDNMKAIKSVIDV